MIRCIGVDYRVAKGMWAVYYFMCAGGGCNNCKLRYTCFTASGDIVIKIEIIKGRGTVREQLEQVTSSKVYSHGSKKYNKMVQKIGMVLFV